jgi:uncharacterized protein
MAALQIIPCASFKPHSDPVNPVQKSVSALFFLLALLSLFFLGCEKQARLDDKSITVDIAGKPHVLELALNSETRFQGLSDRKSIPEGTGMLFVFPSPRVQNFVMRKCYVPIDILYLEPSGRVMKTYTMSTVPYDTPEDDLPRYSSVWPSQFVIELAGGAIAKLGVKEGDIIPLPKQDLLKRAE